MKILAVIGDEAILHQITGWLTSIQPDAEIMSFSSSLAALNAGRQWEADIAILDTELKELSGLDLGLYLLELQPELNLIYFAEGEERSFEAFRQHASGYLLSPASEEMLKWELDDLRHPAAQKKLKRVFAQTFGNFELFVDGKPVAFKYSKTKEIVALLINNRGAQTSNGEIIATLWEDDEESKTSYLSNLRQDLQNTLTKYGISDIIAKQRGSMGIVKDRIECDLYDWLEKREKSRYSYLGDYMNQYSWAEYVHAELDNISYGFEE